MRASIGSLRELCGGIRNKVSMSELEVGDYVFCDIIGLSGSSSVTVFLLLDRHLYTAYRVSELLFPYVTAFQFSFSVSFSFSHYNSLSSLQLTNQSTTVSVWSFHCTDSIAPSHQYSPTLVSKGITTLVLEQNPPSPFLRECIIFFVSFPLCLFLTECC